VPVNHFKFEGQGQTPLLSVCIVTYQHANYIQDCLEGVLMQKTNFNFEILLGDDGSNDGTREICIEYAEKYPRKIRLFLHHRENNIHYLGSPSGRFNLMYSIFQAKGEFLAFCEGDDIWIDPRKLQKQVEILQKNNSYALCYHPWKNAENKNLNELENIRAKNSPRFLTIVCRNIFSEFPRQFIEAPNGDTFLRFMLATHGKFHFLPDIEPGIRRIHAGGVMSPLSELEKLPRRIMTQKMLLDYYRGTRYEPELKRKVEFFETKYQLLKALRTIGLNGNGGPIINSLSKSRLLILLTKAIRKAEIGNITA